MKTLFLNRGSEPTGGGGTRGPMIKREKEPFLTRYCTVSPNWLQSHELEAFH